MLVHPDDTCDSYHGAGALKLLDDRSFEVIDTVQLSTAKHECPLSVVSCPLGDDRNTCFCVGTAHVDPLMDDTEEGRVLVYKVVNCKLVLETECVVKGAVYSLLAFNGHIVSGIGSRVSLFKWESGGDDSNGTLRLDCSHEGHILALMLKARGDFILVGDLMRSMTVIAYKPSDGCLEEVATDFRANWMTLVPLKASLFDVHFISSKSPRLFTT